MIRVLVMANESVLADAILSTLSEETDMDVFRVTHHERRDKVDQIIHQYRPLVIIIEEGTSHRETITASDLLRDYDPLRIFTVSPNKHDLRICESYHVPILGIEHMVNLLRTSTELGQEG